MQRIRLPVWRRVARTAGPSLQASRFSTAPSQAFFTHISSIPSRRHRLQTLIKSGIRAEKASFKEILKELALLRDSALTMQIIKDCSDVNSIDSDEFAFSLKCFQLVGDAESALNFYKTAVASRPELQSLNSLHALLNATKGSTPIALEGIEMYHSALLDKEHFPALRGDIEVASTLLSMYASLSPHYINPQQLDRAVAVDRMLADAGVLPDPGFYSRLIGVYNFHNNYSQARKVYSDFIAADPETNNAVETSMLRAAFAAGEYADCVSVYQRLISSETAGLTDRSVQIMLQVSNHMKMNDLTLDILTRWQAMGGALNWRMCAEILTAALDTSMLKHMSEGASKPARGHPFTAQDIQAKKSLTPTERDRMLRAKRRFNQAMFTHVNHVVVLVKRSLFLGMSRALYQTYHVVGEDETSQSSAIGKQSVPLDVLTKVAALIVDNTPMGLELMLDRVELSGEVFPSEEARKKAHVKLVHSLARDLVVLNRWRELQALGARVEGYSHAADALHYTPAERAYVEVCTAIALKRDARDDLAAYTLSARLVACFNACTNPEEVHETVMSIMHALEQLGGGNILRTEMVLVLVQCVPRIDRAAVDDLVTETFLNTTAPLTLSLYLYALAEWATAAAETSTAPAFQLSDKHIDLIEVILQAQHDSHEGKHVEKARQFMQKICPPQAGI